MDEYCLNRNGEQTLVQDAIWDSSFLDMMDDGLLLEYCAVCKELDEVFGLDSWGIGSVERIVKDKKSFWETLWGALQGKFNKDPSINKKTKRHNQNLSSMGGVFNMTNANLCHCVGNTLVKYKASGRREVSYYPHYVKHQLNAIGAGFYIAFRQVESYIGNFFANLFTGKGDIGIVASGSVQIGDISYGCTITGTVKKGFSIEFDDLKSTGLKTLQSAFNNSPITLNFDGLYVQYKIIKMHVFVNSSDASFKLEITTGKKLKVGELSAGVIVSASYSEGPCATIENRKSESLNNAVDYYQYVNSLEFYLDNWGD